MAEVSGSKASSNGGRGRTAQFDRRTGEVHGSGAGAGGRNAGEDHDDDPTSGGGASQSSDEKVGDPKPRHPLPQSPEARHNEIPETAEREKGVGEDDETLIQPRDLPVDPDGDSYVYDDLGR